MRSRTLAAAAVLSLVLFGLACATPVGVDRKDPSHVRRTLTATVLTSGEPSQSSHLVLQTLGLTQAYEEDPEGVIERLAQGLRTAPNRSARTFALAELCFHHALGGGGGGYFLSSAVFAYAYLFPPDPAQRPGPFEPRRRVAADLYNQALAEGLRTEGSDRVVLERRTLRTPFGHLHLSVDEDSLVWDRYRLVDFVPSVEFGVRGLRNRYRTPGIGAALLAGLEPLDGQDIPRGYRLPPRLRVPVTVVLRFGDVYASLEGRRLAGTLEMYVQDRTSRVQLAGQEVPLEYETTAALAYVLEGSPIWDFELAGFRLGDLNPFAEQAPDGLMLLTPYHSGRIPVVLVHGTASSPARWAELLNEIQGDPTLNERVQVWLFLYPTGNPILLSAGNLRDALVDTVEDLDPKGEDPALRNMVVIGHSQGGLLTKLQAVESGTSFWENVSEQPFDEVELSEATRDLMERVVFFDPLPFVTRVVFMATPHGGSYLATFRLSSLASRLVKLPANLAQRSVEFVDLNKSRRAERRLERMPTSIDNMRPGHPFLEKLHAKPLAPHVTGHSIIGVPNEGPPEGQNDGVVTFESAHIEGMASEVHVRSGHSLQGHPDAVNEVRRILREHLDELGM